MKEKRDKKKAKEQKRKEGVENLKKAGRDARTEGYQAVAAWEEGWSLHGGGQGRSRVKREAPNLW